MRNLSGNKGKIIGIVIVCILIVASIATYAMANRNKKAENTNETVVEATKDIKTETIETEKIEETETVEEETEENNSIDIDYVAAFTCTDTDEESLTELVKNTVNYTKIQLDYNLTESKLYTPVLAKALDSFTQTKTGAIDANSTFDYGENGNPCATANPETDSWTYNDVAGMIGYFVFNVDSEHNSIDYMQAQTSDFLKEFLINDFYHVDANSFSNFELSGVTGETFSKSNYPMEVNYKLQFKYNGQTYTALIGNLNLNYVVLDIVKGAKIESSNNNDNGGKTSNNTSSNNPVPESVAPIAEDNNSDNSNTTNEVPVPETPSNNTPEGPVCGTVIEGQNPNIDYNDSPMILPEGINEDDINPNAY